MLVMRIKGSWACALTIHLDRADLQGTDGTVTTRGRKQWKWLPGVAVPCLLFTVL